MSILQIPQGRVDPLTIGAPLIHESSAGFGDVSRLIAEKLRSIQAPTPTFENKVEDTSKGLQEQLYDTLAAFKVRTATVAMHLDRDWRVRLFSQLDSLLSYDDWEPFDKPPAVSSFATFLRLVLTLRPDRRPGLGATAEGHIIASWTVEGDRLTIECLPNDTVRWHLAVTVLNERESAAGITPTARLREVLAPYGPERWFAYANNLRSA